MTEHSDTSGFAADPVTESSQKFKVVARHLLFPFMLVTILFALWGFANDITNPMVKRFSRILQMSNFEESLVQFAFYGGYFAMAFPAALFIKRYSYKAGILVGLGLYAVGALLGMFVAQQLILSRLNPATAPGAEPWAPSSSWG